MKYSDPDGDNGSIAYTVYNASGAVVQTGAGGTVVSGADSIWYSATSFASGTYHWTAVATDSKGAQSLTSATYSFTVNKDPSAPGTMSPKPVDGSHVPTISPTLTAGTPVASDAEGDTIGYMFFVYQGSSCTGPLVVQSAGWSTSTSWTVPSDKLLDKQTYAWCVQTRDFWPKATYSWSVSSPTTFTVDLPKLGVQSYWPMWHGGGLDVNESTGNLVLQVPAPSFPTGVGSLGLSLVYNSLDTRGSAFGGGLGWTLADASGAPAKLIDHSALSPAFDSVERVEADGSSSYYGHIAADSTRYASPAGDTSVLTGVTSAGSTTGFQLNDPDGSTYTFGPPDGTTGVSTLLSAQVLTANGHGRLNYAFTSGKLTSVVAQGNSSPDGQTANWQTVATLTLKWAGDPNCTGALVCVTGPDGVQWKYVGTTGSGTTGDLQRVSDGTRTLLQIGYDASGRPVSVLNADDLDPSHASPGYATNHSVVISYDTGGRVWRVLDQNVHSAAGSALQTRTTQFDYFAGDCAGSSLQNPRQAHTFSRLTSSYGCTAVTSPNQFVQATPQPARVFYDVMGHPLEVDSPLETSSTNKNYTLYAYDTFNTLEWWEDGNGNATDNSYDPDTHALTQTQAPNPQMTGLGRPTTIYRYDETVAGTASTAGAALTGLQGRYYSVSDFSVPPSGVATDATVDSGTWSGGQPPFLGAQENDISIRWTGEINVPSGGYYLATVADGGSRVTLDGTALLIDKWSGGQTSTAPVCTPSDAITQGHHQIVVEYNEGATGTPSIKLEWGTSCTAAALSVVPTANLLPDWLNQTSTVSPAVSVGGTGIVSFSHYPVAPSDGASAASHTADYSLRTVGSSKLITSYQYDVFGRLTGKVMPNGNSSATIDSSGNLTGAGTASTSSWGTTYSYYGLTENATTPSPLTGVDCEAAGLTPQLALAKTQQQHGLAPVTTIYDAAGRRVSVSKGAGTAYSCYDDAGEGRLTGSLVPGDSQPTIYTYDPAGNPVTATHSGTTDDSVGTVTTSYNEAGQVLTRTDATGAQATYSYDLDGNISGRGAAPTAPATALTLAGNEVTDSVRAAGTQGDGRPSPDSSTGIWQATTNLLTNGGFENDNSGWSTAAGFWNNAATSVTRTTGGGKFGNGYAVITTPGSLANEGIHSASISLTSGKPYTFSVWLKGSGSIKLGAGDATVGSASSPTITLSADWTRYSLTFTPTASGSSAAASVFWATTTAGSFSIDGAQLEQSPIATPYVDTAGATASRAASRVQIPTAALPGLTQGWAAFRLRMGYPSSASASVDDGYQTVLTIPNAAGTLSIVQLYYNSGQWGLYRDSGGYIFKTATFNPGDLTTVVAAWTATGQKISVNGSAFVSIASSASGATSNPSSDIGRWTGGTSGPGFEAIDGDVMWAAFGSGTLNDTDATTINGFGNADPTLSSFSGVAVASAVWDGTSTTVATPGGGTSYHTSYDYNAADQLIDQTDASGYTFHFYYDDRGNLRGTQYPNGTFTWTDTNPNGWTIDQLNRHGTITATTTTPPADASPIADYTYTYAPDGQKLTDQTTGPSSTTATYTYDDLGRLLTYTITGGASARYCYDLDSNRLQVTASSGTACGTATYTYDPANTNSPGIDGLTSVGSTLYHYTSDGQLDCRGTSVGATCPLSADSFRWDGAGTMKSSTVAGKSVCYRYGPDGALTRRIYDATGNTTCTTASSTTNYLLGDTFETNASGTLTASYEAGPAGDLASYNGEPTVASTITYLYYNGHGDLAAEATTLGTRTAAHTYDPFGAPDDTPPANSTSHRYTGSWDKQDDSTTNLILMGARPYDPSIGRFLAVDPIDGGSLNNYDYAGQDPVNGYDLDGTMLQEVDGGPAPRSLAGCGGPSCEEDEAGGTTAAEMVEGATREGRGRLILRGFLRAPSQLRGATWADIGETLENAAAAAGWRFEISEYPNGGTSYRLKSPSPTGGSIIWERAGRNKGGDILKGDWYWRISPGNNRPVVRIK